VPPYFDAKPVPLAVAEAMLDEALDRFWTSHLNGERPRLLIKATMGLGKTMGTADLLAQAQAVLGLDQTIEVYTPRHATADEFETALRNVGAKFVFRIRGRSRDGDDGQPLCRKPALVAGLARQGHSVRRNACYRDESNQCEFYKTCGYWEQYRKAAHGGIRILPQIYLGLPRHNNLGQPHLVVIDEDFLQSSYRPYRIKIGHLEARLDQADKTLKLGSLIARALQNSRPLLRELRQAGVRPETLEERVKKTRAIVGDLAAIDTQVMAEIEKASAQESVATSALLFALAEEMRTHPQRDEATRVRYWARESCVAVDLLPPLAIPDHASVLVLDATADAGLLGQVIPGLRVVRIDAEQNLNVTQVHDRTGSNASWEGKSGAKNVDDLELVLRARAKARDRILVVAHKALADALRIRDLPNTVSIENFGNLRGANSYRDCQTIIVTGRHHPPLQHIEGLARAIWWKDPVPLAFDAGAAMDKDPDERLETQLRGYRMRDANHRIGVMVPVFQDPRIEAVYQSLKEAETAQAIARLRAIRSNAPKRAILLSNLPVDVTVDRLVAWDDWMPDRRDRVVEKIGYLPKTDEAMHKDAPELFVSPKAAKDYRLRNGGRALRPYL